MTYTVTENSEKCKYTDCVDGMSMWIAFPEVSKICLYINPETSIDCNACVEECPVEAIYADVDVPEKWEHYTPLNAEKCEEYPVIIDAKDPLPSARTLEEIQANDG
jgi:Indolepyruvate ferredoxin oxidoreductase, alpha and beta subunits